MPINSYFENPLSWQPSIETITHPIYLGLASRLESDINRGIVVSGVKLPSQRELADYLDISFTTVTRAYKICESKGLIFGKIGSGTYVSDSINIDLTISKNESTNNLIDLGFVSSLDQVTKYAIENIKKAVQVKYLEELLSYKDPTGMDHHKQLGVLWLKRFGIEVDKSNLSIVSGTQNGLSVILLSLFSSGDSICVDEYTYSNFISLARMHNINLIPIKNDSFGMIPDELEKYLKFNSVNGVFIMPSCSNPTGICMPTSRKIALSKVFEKYPILIIEDDNYAFLTSRYLEKEYQTFYSLLPNQTFYLSGLSKPLYGGLRVAFLAFPPCFKKSIEEGIFNINVKTSSLEVEIANQIIKSGKIDELISYKKELLINYQNIFNNFFPDSVINHHSPISFYRWLPVKSDITSDFEHTASLHGLKIFHSSRFCVGSNQGENFLRVSFGTVQDATELSRGLTILKKLLSD